MSPSETQNPSFSPVLPPSVFGQRLGPVEGMTDQSVLPHQNSLVVGRQVGRQVMPISSAFVLPVLPVLPKMKTSYKKTKIQVQEQQFLSLELRFSRMSRELGTLGRTGRTGGPEPAIALALRPGAPNPPAGVDQANRCQQLEKALHSRKRPGRARSPGYDANATNPSQPESPSKCHRPSRQVSQDPLSRKTLPTRARPPC